MSGSCPPGKYVNVSQLSCEQKHLCEDCPPGYYCLTGVLKTPCPTEHGGLGNMTSITDCEACPVGRYSDKSGQNWVLRAQFAMMGRQLFAQSNTEDCREILVLSVDPAMKPVTVQGRKQPICQECPAGYRGDGTGSSCVLCPKGTYQNQLGQKKCKKCTSDLCNFLYGATTNKIGSTGLVKRSSDLMNHSLSATNTTTIPTTDKYEISNSLIWAKIPRDLFTFLAAIGLMMVALHRYFLETEASWPLFAGDHYIGIRTYFLLHPAAILTRHVPSHRYWFHQ